MRFPIWTLLVDILVTIVFFVALVYLAMWIHRYRFARRSGPVAAVITEFLTKLDLNSKSDGDAEVFRRGLNDFESLSRNDQACFHSQMDSLLEAFDAVLHLRDEGVLPDSELNAATGVLVSILSSPGAQRWWESYKHLVPPVLVVYLEQAMGRADGSIEPASEKYPWLRAN